MTKQIIKFLRIQKEINKVRKRNVIELDCYFKYSGKVNHKKRFVDHKKLKLNVNRKGQKNISTIPQREGAESKAASSPPQTHV